MYASFTWWRFGSVVGFRGVYYCGGTVMKIINGVFMLTLAGCASVPSCPPQPIRTESVCVGQQTVIRYRDFLGDVHGKSLCPPIYVVTAQLCGR